MRILIVDDEHDIRTTSRLLLEAWGYEVHTAKDGADALDCVESWTPDAVLVDLSMAGIDGFVTTRKLRRACGGAPLLIVACSAHCGDAPTRNLALAAGCDECLMKPVDWERLRAMLTRFQTAISMQAIPS